MNRREALKTLGATPLIALPGLPNQPEAFFSLRCGNKMLSFDEKDLLEAASINDEPCQRFGFRFTYECVVANGVRCNYLTIVADGAKSAGKNFVDQLVHFFDIHKGQIINCNNKKYNVAYTTVNRYTSINRGEVSGMCVGLREII